MVVAKVRFGSFSIRRKESYKKKYVLTKKLEEGAFHGTLNAIRSISLIRAALERIRIFPDFFLKEYCLGSTKPKYDRTCEHSSLKN